MHTWYCPECGRERELGDCAVGRVLGVEARLYCPRCHRRIRVAGPALIVAALLICLFEGLSGVPLAFMALTGFTLAGLGVLRMAQQTRAQGRREGQRERNDPTDRDQPS